MKNVVINHDVDTLNEAFGVENSVLADKMSDIVKEFMTDEYEHMSQIGELIQKTMTDSEILLMATQHIIQTLDSFRKEMQQLELLTKKFNA